MNEVRPRPAAGQQWKHRKGHVYTVIGVTNEPSEEKAHKFPVTVFYRAPDGRVWSRKLDSWMRSFTLIPGGVKSTWDGDGLPPIDCDVMVKTLNGSDAQGSVTGYHLLGALSGVGADYYRVFVDLVDRGSGKQETRLLRDVSPVKASS